MNKINAATTSEKIQKRNARFLALSPEKQRVKIAKDVLASLETKRIKASPGTYFELSKPIQIGKNKDLQNIIQDAQFPTCEVCALGSIFHALVDNADRFKLTSGHLTNTYDVEKGGYARNRLQSLGSEDGMRQLLRKHFSPRQITLIESAFEKEAHIDPCDIKSDRIQAVKLARKWGRSQGGAVKRLTSIMENIIANKGEFKP